VERIADNTSDKVEEAWSGPGRGDGEIAPLPPGEDGLHIELGKKGQYEWWYFDAHLDGGYTVVAFFYAANPNPGNAGKAGVELTLLRPDGTKTQKFFQYPWQEFEASREKAQVRVGRNYLKSEAPAGGLPVYEIHLEEGEMAFDLTYRSQVNGWRPGSGYSRFRGMGYFAWVVPVPRAAVEASIRDGGRVLQAKGIGYHDHNWLDFPFQSIIEYWMWGRVYSENYTASYAYIKCNPRVDGHVIKVLMLARREKVIVSTGEFELSKLEFEHSPAAGHAYPKRLIFKVPTTVGMEMELAVSRVLEAVNMLDAFNPLLRFLARHVMRIKPGYFRLLSNFRIEVTQDGSKAVETGTTLHEIVIFKKIEAQ